MRPRVNTEKHIRQLPIDSVGTGTINNATVLVAVDQPSSNAIDVRVGSVVSAVYIELWVLAGSQQPGSITVTLEKLVAGQTPMSFVQGALLNEYPNKKNIFYTTQGVTPDANGNPVPFVRQWIKIPRGKQRMGLGDSMVLNVQANVENETICGVFIYKEQF